MGNIYIAQNIINKKIYVGKSTDVKNRIKAHQFLAGKDNSIFHKALHKYGLSNFKWDIICECKDEDLNEQEVYWIKYYNTHYITGFGYNMSDGGEGQLGFRHSETTKSNMSLIKTGVCNTFYGKNHTDKTKKSISLANSDKDIYTFENVLTKEIFKGTRLEFKDKFNFIPYDLFKKSRIVKISNKWRLI